MTIEAPIAARILLHKLAQQPDLYGLWLDPDWAAVWDALTAIAATPCQNTEKRPSLIPRLDRTA